MMNCNAYRRALLADPHDSDPGLREHLDSCHDCTAYTEELLRFEARLGRALKVSARLPVYPRTWLAMAASVLLAVAVAGVLWLSVPPLSLAADVVTHMKEEPQAWLRTDVPVPNGSLQEVLSDSHLRLADGADMVSYASSCLFRGRLVPHLAIQTESGTVTVMVLVHENVSKPMRFDEQGYRGVIVPVAGHGSIAVLTRGPGTGLEAIEHIAARVQNSIVWTD
jgi:Protein of unknown function (DUF3379)